MRSALLLLAISLDIVWSDSDVPVLVWGSKSDPFNYHAPALKTLSTSEFYNDIVRKTLHNVPAVGVFVEPSLGLEDLRWRGEDNKSAYPYVENEMSSSKFTKYLPRVDDPVKAIEALIDEENYRVLTFDLSHNLPDKSMRNVFIIKLKNKGIDADRFESLRSHDKQINEFCKLIEAKYGKAVCLLTADERSWPEPIHASSLRKLLAVTENNAKPLNVWFKDSIMVYTKSAPMLTDKRENKTYDFQKEDTDVITMNNKPQDSSVTLQVKQPRSNNTRLNYIFRIDGSNWKLEGVKVTDANNQETTLITPSFIGSSFGYSYHTPLKVTFTGGNWELTFDTLQAEVYRDKRSTPEFSVADDVVGFFTIPIWSGILVVILLITIVLAGLSMIYDIKTMDQFDDPKGKPVTINATE